MKAFNDLADFSAEEISTLLDLARNVLAKDKVLYHGHAIVAIAAKTAAIAEQALALILAFGA